MIEAEDHDLVMVGHGDAGDAATTIKAVARAAQFLEVFTLGSPRVTLAQIAQHLDVGRASVQRYALTLQKLGFVRFDRPTRSYTLGPRVLTLSAAVVAGNQLTAVAAPFMRRLVRATRETVMLSVWDVDAAIVVATDDSHDRTLRVIVEVGARLGPRSAESQLFARPPVDHVVVVSSAEYVGLRAVATPVFDADGMAAALTLIGTTATLPDAVDSPLARSLREAAVELSAALGGAGVRSRR